MLTWTIPSTPSAEVYRSYAQQPLPVPPLIERGYATGPLLGLGETTPTPVVSWIALAVGLLGVAVGGIALARSR